MPRKAILAVISLIGGVAIAFAYQPAVIDPNWPRVVNKCHSIQHRIAETDRTRTNRGLDVVDVDTVNAWLAGDVSEEEQPLLGPQPELDAWKHPYRCVRDIRGADEAQIAVGAYSLGEDGVSNSNGNDPDDLNSWDPDCFEIYANRLTVRTWSFFAVKGLFSALCLYLLISLFFPERRPQRTRSSAV